MTCAFHFGTILYGRHMSSRLCCREQSSTFTFTSRFTLRVSPSRSIAIQHIRLFHNHTQLCPASATYSISAKKSLEGISQILQETSHHAGRHPHSNLTLSISPRNKSSDPPSTSLNLPKPHSRDFQSPVPPHYRSSPAHCQRRLTICPFSGPTHASSAGCGEHASSWHLALC